MLFELSIEKIIILILIKRFVVIYLFVYSFEIFLNSNFEILMKFYSFYLLFQCVIGISCKKSIIKLK